MAEPPADGLQPAAAAERGHLPGAPVALIPSGARFEGLVAFRHADPVRVDGELRGAVVGAGLLEIGESARVEGRIEVAQLRVAGAVEGRVRARERAELLPTARVNGELRTPRLTLAEGCLLQGRCQTGPDAS